MKNNKEEKNKIKKYINIFLMIILIINLIGFATGDVNNLTFWTILVIIYIYSKKFN